MVGKLALSLGFWPLMFGCLGVCVHACVCACASCVCIFVNACVSVRMHMLFCV